MADVDFELLRRRIAESARCTWEALRSKHPDETFYTFALYTVDDAVGINPSANTEQAFQRASHKFQSDAAHLAWLRSVSIDATASLLGDHRWSPYDWEYECAESQGFGAVNELINNRGQGFYDDDDPLGFVKFKAGVLASMALALGDLDRQGCFGKGADRELVTVFCSIAHSECTAWFEEDTAIRLNPPGQLRTFARERIAYIAEAADSDDMFASHSRAVHSHYLSLVE